MSRGRCHQWSAALFIGALAAGCEDSNSTADESPEGALVPYAGTWQPAEPLYRNDAFNPVADAVRVTRPEYSAQEIKDYLASAFSDVDYTTLRVEGQSITFLSGTTTLCAGRYSPRAAHEHQQGDAGGHDQHESRVFDLVSPTAGSCDTYAQLNVSALELHGTTSHFHVSYGQTSGLLRPPPWNPPSGPPKRHLSHSRSWLWAQ